MYVYLAAAMLSLSAGDVADESVVCLENDGSGETMWVALAEKYYTGTKTVRQVEIEPGKKKCLRYDGVKTVTVSHFYMSEVQRRIKEREKIDPWRKQACDRVAKNAAVFFRLGSKNDKEMTCEADSSRDDAGIRALVEDAKPFSM